MFEREQVSVIRERMLEEGNNLIKVVVGPRQTGKSTMIAQALRGLGVLSHSVSADDVLAPAEEWLRSEWQQARNLQRMSDRLSCSSAAFRARRNLPAMSVVG